MNNEGNIFLTCPPGRVVVLALCPGRMSGHCIGLSMPGEGTAKPTHQLPTTRPVLRKHAQQPLNLPEPEPKLQSFSAERGQPQAAQGTKPGSQLYVALGLGVGSKVWHLLS